MNKWLRFATVFCISIVLSGCWGHTEIKELGIVHSLGIDRGEKQKIKMTIELSRPTEETQGGGGGAQGRGIVISGEGDTLFEVARILKEKSVKNLLWAHTGIIIFGKEIAKEGIQGYIDPLLRQRHFRESAFIFVMDGKAEDVFETHTDLPALKGFGIKGLIEAENWTSRTKSVTINTTYSTLVNQYNDLTLPALVTYKDKQQKKMLRVGGLFVFKKDRLHTYIEPNLAKGFLRLNNQAEMAVESLEVETNKFISFENVRSHAKLMPILASGKPKLHIEIFADFNVAGIQTEVKDLNSKVVEQWESLLNERIKKETTAFIELSQKKKIDPLGVGEMFHRAYPVAWKQLKPNWSNLYADLSYTIVVKSRIEHYYLNLSS